MTSIPLSAVSTAGAEDDTSFTARFALFAILAATCYQLLLCFLFTHGMHTSNTTNVLAEVLILALVGAKTLPQQSLYQLALLALAVTNFLILWAIRGEIDLVAPRDVIIIALFFWLGWTVKRQDVNRIIWIVSGLVLFVGFFEAAFTTSYLKVFDILHYYAARTDTPNAITPKYLHTNLFVSGLRPGGRVIFPFLGPHRISSIFLEPVSMGNYAAIVAMWGLSYKFSEWRKSIGHLILAFVFVVASDSRFAGTVVFVLLLVRLFPVLRPRISLIAFPIASLAFVVLYAAYGGADPNNDNLPGRIARTGEIMNGMDVSHLLGLSIPENLVDMGIPYTFEIFGLLLSVALWLRLSMMRVSGPAAHMRSMIAVYCIALLMISGTSLYSSKTASIMWLGFGCLMAMEVAPRAKADEATAR